MRIPTKLLSLLFVGSACLAGCERQQAISSYPAPKEPPRVAQIEQPDMAPARPLSMAQMPAEEEPKWKVPEGWKPTSGDPMRYASFALGDEQPPLVVSVIRLPEQQLLANVNRWQQQLGLPPTPEADLKKVVQQIDSGGVQIDLVDLASAAQANGQPQARMLAAMIPRPGSTWFVKLVGPSVKVEAQKDNFDKFLRSITFAAVVPATMPALPQAAGGLTLSGYKTPEGWQQGPARSMRVATFLMGPQDKLAELAVQKWPAAIFADALSNINRWRAQTGLPPVQNVKDSAQQPMDIGGLKATVYDMAGPQTRMLVGVAGSGEEIWFFKLMGPADVVTQQKPAFEAFLKSVQFSGKP